MKRQATLLVVLTVFLVFTGIAVGERPVLGPFTTSGYATDYPQVEFLPSGYHAKFHLPAAG